MTISLKTPAQTRLYAYNTKKANWYYWFNGLVEYTYLPPSIMLDTFSISSVNPNINWANIKENDKILLYNQHSDNMYFVIGRIDKIFPNKKVNIILEEFCNIRNKEQLRYIPNDKK